MGSLREEQETTPPNSNKSWLNTYLYTKLNLK